MSTWGNSVKTVNEQNLNSISGFAVSQKMKIGTLPHGISEVAFFVDQHIATGAADQVRQTQRPPDQCFD